VIEAVSNMMILFDPAAALYVPPDIQSEYFLVRAVDVHDVDVVGATLVGWNDPALEPVQAHGILFKSVDRASIRDCRVIAARHDGIYVGGGPGAPCTRVRVTGTQVAGAGRNGLRVAHARDLVVQGCRFVATGGIPEEAGVDFEPETGNVNSDIRFIGNLCANNRTSGLTISSRLTQMRILVVGNTFRNNTTHGINTGCDEVLFHGNVFRDNGADGIQFGTAHGLAVGNTFNGNQGMGIDFS
jgi:hypothetical protein